MFHPWWGLNADTAAFADRLAGAGFNVVAPDMYDGQIEVTVDGAEARSERLDESSSDAIALAAVDHLAGILSPTARIGAVGFSMGASWAMWAPAERDRLAASVVYYGSITGPSLRLASVPVLGHFAEADAYEPDESIDDFRRNLLDGGRAVTIHRYGATSHWFAEPSRDAFQREASDLAFQRTVAFLDECLSPPDQSLVRFT